MAFAGARHQKGMPCCKAVHSHETLATLKHHILLCMLVNALQHTAPYLVDADIITVHVCCFAHACTYQLAANICDHHMLFAAGLRSASHCCTAELSSWVEHTILVCLLVLVSCLAAKAASVQIAFQSSVSLITYLGVHKQPVMCAWLSIVHTDVAGIWT